MILLIEGGTGFWPGAGIGFKQTIELYNHQKITLPYFAIYRMSKKVVILFFHVLINDLNRLILLIVQRV